ncbi:unnamed protein product, partial [Didymodactylos carnosus]
MSSAIRIIVRTLLNPLKRAKRENLYAGCYTNSYNNNYDEKTCVIKTTQYADITEQHQESSEDADWHQILLTRLKNDEVQMKIGKNSDYIEENVILQKYKHRRTSHDILNEQNKSFNDMYQPVQSPSSSYESIKKFNSTLPSQINSSKESSNVNKENGSGGDGSTSKRNYLKLQEKFSPSYSNVNTMDRGTTMRTVAYHFKHSLTELIEKMNSCECHFVRCIKPNDTKDKQTCLANCVSRQLRYSGVLNMCEIRRKGYPLRVTFSEFLQ